MTFKQSLVGAAIGVTVFAAGVAVGQENIDPNLHPHLYQAQRQIATARGEIDQAQASWGDKLGGHALKAKNLLQQADEELKQAALYANKYK